MIGKSIIVAKSVSAGGISVVFMQYFNDTEFVILFVTGLFASVTSFMYDFAHRDTHKFGLKEFTELFKYIFYGVPVMIIIFYYATLNLQEIANIPPTIWGFISMLCAGSAVTIVEYFAPTIGSVANAILKKLGGVK